MTRDKEKLRICLAASGGGHLTELLAISDSYSRYETFCITTVPAVQGNLQEFGHVYVVGECNRNSPLRVLKVFGLCARIIFQNRPDVVISTGAAPGCIVCFFGKILGARIIWLDSIANVDKISLSGRMVRYIADLFLVQWPELASKYKHVEYAGTVI